MLVCKYDVDEEIRNQAQCPLRNVGLPMGLRIDAAENDAIYVERDCHTYKKIQTRADKQRHFILRKTVTLNFL